MRAVARQQQLGLHAIVMSDGSTLDWRSL